MKFFCFFFLKKEALASFLECDLHLHGALAVSGEVEGADGVVDGDDFGEEGCDVDGVAGEEFDGHGEFGVEAEGAAQGDFLGEEGVERYGGFGAAVADLHQGAGGAQGCDGGADGDAAAGGFEGGVEMAFVAGVVGHGVFVLADVDGAVGGDFAREGEGGVEQVGDHDFAGAGVAGDHGAEHADGAGAGDEDAAAEEGAGLADGVQADGEGLGEGGAFERHGGRDGLGFVADQEFAEAALDVRHAHGAAVEAHVQAVLLGAFETVFARLAGQRGVDGDAISDLDRCDAGADGFDDAGHFVSEHNGLAHAHRAKAAMMIVVEIGAADAAVVDADADLMRTGLAGLHVIDTQVMRRMKDDGFHGMISGACARCFEPPGRLVNPGAFVIPPRVIGYDKKVALVLQGGGALGSYQAGAYEAIAASAYAPDWVSGISIGAINAALIAGNPRERRAERLRAFWEGITTPAVALPRMFDGTLFDEGRRQAASLQALVFGQPGFFAPRPQIGQTTSYYDTAPLRETLERLVDFDRINAREMAFSVAAVNVRSGNFAWFDNRYMTIRPEHVMASGALPPGFPPVEIDGEPYWDGGLVSNTPLQYVIDHSPRVSRLVFQVDLFASRGALPTTLDEVSEREKDIRFSSRTRAGDTAARETHDVRFAINALWALLPAGLRATREAQALYEYGCVTTMDVAQLIYRPAIRQGSSKDYEFSRQTMEARWAQGHADASATIEAAPWLAPMQDGVGARSFDVMRPAGGD